MITNPYLLFTILIITAFVVLKLEKNYTWAKKISTSVLALLIGMFLSNTHIICDESVAYDFVWDYVLPFSIPFLLWNANIKKIYRDSKRLLRIYLISALGTFVGVILAYFCLRNFISNLNTIGAMMCGTYIGGSVNLIAISKVFSVNKSVLSASIVADNLLMAIYFFVLIMIPDMPLIKKHFVVRRHEVKEKVIEQKSLSPMTLLKACIISVLIVTGSKMISSFFGNIETQSVLFNALLTFMKSEYIWLTTLSIVFANVFPKQSNELTETKIIGEYLMTVFFVVIGIPASIMTILEKMPLLFVFNFIIIFTNMIFTLGFGKLFHHSIESICVASNANIGGPTTAAAYATSKGWDGLIVPALLVGTLGYAIGNYAGILIGTIL